MIKYIRCYFESNNPRGQAFSKHEAGGSLPRGDRACSQAFVLLDGEDMGLGVLVQVWGISAQLNKAPGPLGAGRRGYWRNPGAFLSLLGGRSLPGIRRPARTWSHPDSCRSCLTLVCPALLTLSAGGCLLWQPGWRKGDFKTPHFILSTAGTCQQVPWRATVM